MSRAVRSVTATTMSMPLSDPIVFPDRRITDREVVVVEVSTATSTGRSFTLTRNGPVEQMVQQILAPEYIGKPVEHALETFHVCRKRHAAILLAGVGLRAHSLVDLAAHDLWALEENVTVARLLGHEQPPRARVRAIVGYPPAAGPDVVVDQVRRWGARGVASFKLPVAVSRQLTVERVAAVLQEAPEAVVGLDLAWSGSSVEDVLELLSLLPTATAFIEDPFMPGQIADLEDLTRVAQIPVQVGDEDGGPYFPGAILDRGLPVGIRLDATCMGGVSGLSGLAGQLALKPLVTSWHMNSRVHLQLAAALGLGDGYVELSGEGDGVDPFEESLPGLTVEEGSVSVPEAAPGFALPPLPIRPWRPPV